MECAGVARPLRPSLQAKRAVALAPLAVLVVLAVAVHELAPTAFTPAGCEAWSAVRTRSSRGEAVVRRVSKYYSNEDRERLARQRKETRLARRDPEQKGPTTRPLNYDMLPPIEEIYSRVYSGNATADPVGGRKRYTYYVLFKADPGALGQEALKKQILEYIWFFKNKMSCKDVLAQTRKSPIDGLAQVRLEYPMKEYGQLRRGQTAKDSYNKATLVEFRMTAPVQAGEYIQKKFYGDNNILRFMVLGHTRRYWHLGEDNELHL